MNEGGEHESSVQGVMTESGYIKKSLLREKVQIGFERATIEDVEKELQSVAKLLDKWEIVALKTGVVRGQGYSERINGELYGP